MTTPDFRKQNILNGDSAVSNNHGTGVRCFYPASEKRKQAPSQQAQPADQSGTAHTQLIFTQKAVYATSELQKYISRLLPKMSRTYVSPYTFILFSQFPASFLYLLVHTPFFSPPLVLLH